MNTNNPSLCVVPKFQGSGGPSAFLVNLRKGLLEQEIGFEDNLADFKADTILVLGGTRHLADLWRAKQRGVRIVQRLDGMNWLHRRRWTGIKHFLRSEWLNFNLALIRRHFADFIIYQSEFTKGWWTQVYGEVAAQHLVIINGVDVSLFTPSTQSLKIGDRIRIAVVEGSFHGGHERDLLNALELAGALAKSSSLPVELSIAGRIPETMRTNVNIPDQVTVHWLGIISKEQVINLNQNAYVFFSAEINAPCPNSVLEALACGVPVISYRTGSLPELVLAGAGELTPYGANHWKLEPPDTQSLASAAMQVLDQHSLYSQTARASAVDNFNAKQMLEKYLTVLMK